MRDANLEIGEGNHVTLTVPSVEVGDQQETFCLITFCHYAGDTQNHNHNTKGN